ncbi:sulfotransferase [Parvularcula marina]|uniref:tetratricopeptide repeat-containing sulfotransferase family protein n=1 Tax=Parvularcula marina TaxID=2292771 RepID=UPI003511F044
MMTVDNLHQRQLEEAARLLEAKDYRAAHAVCIEVLTADPANSEAYHLLGILTAEHGNHQKACEIFDRALAVDSARADTLAHKARSLIALNHKEEAVRHAELAAAAAPEDALTLDTIGVVFSRAGLHDRAVSFYEQAVSLSPDTPNLHYNLGAALQFIGRMDEARAAYRQAVALDPDDARALTAAVQITRQSREENDIAALEAAFARLKEDEDAALHLGHALAKAHEDMGEPEKALIWLAHGKARKKQSLGYDPVTDQRLFDAACRTAGFASVKGEESAEPIFITGMPRTGTTLVERILSSHSEVQSAGELTDFALCVKRMTGTPSPYVLDPETLAAAEDIDADALGAAYMQSVQSTQKIGGRFIDKMPLNIFFAPLILRALPNARVICLRRHPADTVLSNYRQLFATGFSYYNYAYDLTHTAQYYAGFDRMVRHFAKNLPADRFCEVHYERVVEDIDTEARRLLDFCGLDFEPGCIDFHKNASPVATASSAQVRQPLYRTSLDRWRRYRPGIDEALKVLIAEGCLPADALE